MQVFLEKSFVEFNNFSFGIAAEPPAFIITPKSFEVSKNDECSINEAEEVCVQLQLDLLDAAFAALLDAKGRPKHITSNLFSTNGSLYLEELDIDNSPTGNIFRLNVNYLSGDIRYIDIPEKGRRLILNFSINLTPKGAYMERID